VLKFHGPTRVKLIALLRRWSFNVIGQTDSHQVGYTLAGAACKRKYQCFRGKSHKTSTLFFFVAFGNRWEVLSLIRKLFLISLITMTYCEWPRAATAQM